MIVSVLRVMSCHLIFQKMLDCPVNYSLDVIHFRKRNLLKLHMERS